MQAPRVPWRGSVGLPSPIRPLSFPRQRRCHAPRRAEPSKPADVLLKLRESVQSRLTVSELSEPGYEGLDPLPEFNPPAAVGGATYEVMRLDPAEGPRRLCVRRRDLLRAHRLAPRDLRQLDHDSSASRAPPRVVLKDGCVLMNLGGVR